MKKIHTIMVLVLLGLLVSCGASIPELHVTKVSYEEKPLGPGTYLIDNQSGDPDGGGSVDQQHFLVHVNEAGDATWTNIQNTAGPKNLQVIGPPAIAVTGGVVIEAIRADTERHVADRQSNALIEASANSSPSIVILNESVGGTGGDAIAGTQTDVDVETSTEQETVQPTYAWPVPTQEEQNSW